MEQSFVKCVRKQLSKWTEVEDVKANESKCAQGPKDKLGWNWNKSGHCPITQCIKTKEIRRHHYLFLFCHNPNIDFFLR